MLEIREVHQEEIQRDELLLEGQRPKDDEMSRIERSGMQLRSCPKKRKLSLVNQLDPKLRKRCQEAIQGQPQEEVSIKFPTPPSGARTCRAIIYYRRGRNNG